MQRKNCKNILSKDQEDFENILYLIGWESVMITTVDLDKKPKIYWEISF